MGGKNTISHISTLFTAASDLLYAVRLKLPKPFRPNPFSGRPLRVNNNPTRAQVKLATNTAGRPEFDYTP